MNIIKTTTAICLYPHIITSAFQIDNRVQILCFFARGGIFQTRGWNGLASFEARNGQETNKNISIPEIHFENNSHLVFIAKMTMFSIFMQIQNG